MASQSEREVFLAVLRKQFKQYVLDHSVRGDGKYTWVTPTVEAFVKEVETALQAQPASTVAPVGGEVCGNILRGHHCILWAGHTGFHESHDESLSARWESDEVEQRIARERLNKPTTPQGQGDVDYGALLLQADRTIKALQQRLGYELGKQPQAEEQMRTGADAIRDWNRKTPAQPAPTVAPTTPQGQGDVLASEKLEAKDERR